MKRLVIPSTIYNLFIYMLLDENWKKRSYMLKLKNFNKNFLKKLNENRVESVYFDSIKYKKIKPFKRMPNYIYYIFNIFKCVIFLYYKKIEIIYGADHIFPLIFKLRPSYLIEDGLLNYKLSKNKGKLKQKIKDFLLLQPSNYKSYGYEKNVRKIYLTGLAPIPKEIESKVEIINLKELWNKKTEKEKKEILDIFCFDENIINKIKNKKNILFTQPLSEDRFISEEEKIELYRKIIFNYSEKDLIIKTHPREKTDYKKYFPEMEILNQSFPSELFDLLDIKFERTITIFSTAALGFSKDSKVDFYGTKVHPNLLKLWGDSEKIMKANKFL